MLKYGQNNVHVAIERPLNFQKSNGSHGGPYFSSLRVGSYVGNVKMHYSYPFQLCKKVSEINQRPGFYVLNFLSNYPTPDKQKNWAILQKNQFGKYLVLVLTTKNFSKCFLCMYKYTSIYNNSIFQKLNRSAFFLWQFLWWEEIFEDWEKNLNHIFRTKAFKT